jgi:hypothetical protein
MGSTAESAIELHEVDHAGRRRSHLLDVLLGHHDIAPLLELEALDDLGIRHSVLQVGHQRFCCMRDWQAL